MSDERLHLSAHLEPAATTDRIARAEMARALAHPRLAEWMPFANGALAVGLGVYSLVYLFFVFSIVF